MGVCTARSPENDFTLGIGVSKFAMAPFTRCPCEARRLFPGLRLTRGFFEAWIVAFVISLRPGNAVIARTVSFVLKSIGNGD